MVRFERSGGEKKKRDEINLRKPVDLAIAALSDFTPDSD